MRDGTSKQPEAGYVLVTVAVMLVVLVGFTALAIDTGISFGARTQAQRAADAAALAGAYTFTLNSASLVGNQTQAERDAAIAKAKAKAETHALQAAKNNTVMGIPIETRCTVGTNATPPTPGFLETGLVRVTIACDEPTFFARILGWTGVNIAVEATAEAANRPTSAMCVKPFFVPNTLDLNGNPQDPCTKCGTSNLLLGADLQPTAYAQTLIGKEFILKPQDPKVALAPSQFFIIDLDNGKSDLKTSISTCLSKATVCRTSYDVLPGNTSGLKGGIDDLVGSPPDTYVQDPANNCPGGSPCYLVNGTKRDTSKQLALAPIWDPCVPQDDGTQYCPFPSGSGTKVKIIGFALVFIDFYQDSGPPAQKGVHAHLINVQPACDGASDWDLDGATANSIPIRLVQPQQ